MQIVVVVVVVVRLSMFVCVVQFLVLWMSFPPLYSSVTPSLSPGAIPRVLQQFEYQSVTLGPPSCVMRSRGCVPSHRVGWSFITVPCHVIRLQNELLLGNYLVFQSSYSTWLGSLD